MDFIVMIRNGGECAEFVVSGCEASWEAYRKAVDFCEFVDGACDLVDAQTGEVIESFSYDDEAEEDCYEENWDDLECGFDPYMGCYSDDC